LTKKNSGGSRKKRGWVSQYKYITGSSNFIINKPIVQYTKSNSYQ